MKANQGQAQTVLRNNGLQASNAKAVNAGLGGAIAVLVIGAIGKWTGAIDVPGEGAIAEAIVAVVVAGVAGAGVAWRTWIVPYLARSAQSLLLFGVLAVGLAGCGAYQQAVEWSTGALATAIDEACAAGGGPLAMEARKATVADINSKTTVGNYTPADCDSDGQMDFPMDADGIPLPDAPTS